jgi:UDP-GlcNAc:undecaprenyl-phosphate GlcNAc-1-phosphate transferase
VNPWQYVIVAGVAALVTLALTPLVRRIATRYGLVDEPGGRKVHTKPIPRVGGIAMFVGVMAAIGVEAAGEAFMGWTPYLLAADGPFIGALIGMTMIFALGVLDDIVTLEPKWKFLGQIVAATVVAAAGLRVDFVGNPFGGGLIDIGMLAWPVTIIWIVGFTNVINLADGLDGLAAGITAIAAGTFLVLATLNNQVVAAIMAAALIGACLGFLRYNFNPASIFMGDSGSMFLGFTLATIALVGVLKSAAAITLVLPLLIIGVPVFDTASAILRRLRHQKPIHIADKGHIHHRLLNRGFNQRQTVLIIYVWSIALAVGGYSMRFVPTLVKAGVFLVLAALSGLMAYWLGLFEVVHAEADDDGDAPADAIPGEVDQAHR